MAYLCVGFSYPIMTTKKQTHNYLDDIKLLVDNFYSTVQKDAFLGPILIEK
jgi:hemoglobin